MEFLFIGLAVGAVVAYFIFARFNKEKSKLKTNEQSLVIMDKIRSVCKFITVEGDFSEVYHYENLKEKYLSLLLGKKKAIEVSVPYRVRVGEAEINTWGDGRKNLIFLFSMRLGLAKTKTPWGPESD